MSEPTDLHVVVVDQEDPRLGRQVVHDPRSRAFAAPVTVDRSTWRSHTIRIYDPTPNPNQVLGDCTGCQKAMAFNATGARVRGRILGLDWADQVYTLATQNDPFPGSYPPDDTGSSSLAAAKAAAYLGVGGTYRWLFGGADEVVQAVTTGLADGTPILPVGLGTWWYEGGFQPFSIPGGGVRIEMTGKRVGGHQWTVRGYDVKRDLLLGRCWWGSFRDFWIKREHVAELLADDGDANVQLPA
jgi:hypothetical protein